MDGLRKALFRSPTDDGAFKKGSEIENLLNKIQVEIEVENNLNIMEKELHEKRLSKMREILEESRKDEWKFNKIETYIES